MILPAQQKDEPARRADPSTQPTTRLAMSSPERVTEASSQRATAQPDKMSTLKIQASKELQFLLHEVRDDEVLEPVCAEAISPDGMPDASPADLPDL